MHLRVLHQYLCVVYFFAVSVHLFILHLWHTSVALELHCSVSAGRETDVFFPLPVQMVAVSATFTNIEIKHLLVVNQVKCNSKHESVQCCFMVKSIFGDVEECSKKKKVVMFVCVAGGWCSVR